MNTSINHAATLPRRSVRRPLIAALLLSVLMVLVWSSFFALRDDQSVRVLFTAGTYSLRNGERAAHAPESSADAQRRAARGTALSTGDDGFITVRLSDGTIVKLMPNTRLDIEDARANRRHDRFTTSLRLLSGEVETLVKRGDGANRELNLFSSSVAIGVRGTVFSVIQDDKQARVMVTRGKIVAAGNVGESTPINANEGTVVASGSPVREVVSLPAPPQADGMPQSVADGVRFAWQSAIAQDAYQVEIAQDDEFLRLLKRHVVNWQQGTLPPIDRDGLYYWRVAGIDAQGLRGPYSEAFALEQDFYLARSRAALQQGDIDAVRANLALTDKALDEDIDRLRERALMAISRQQFAAATADLDMVLALRSKDAPARNALAGAQFQLLDYDAARENFNDTVQRQDVDVAVFADAQAGIALIDVRQGNFAAALERARSVLAKDAVHRHALNVAAMACVGLGERELALQYIQQVLALYTDDPTALALRQSLQAPPLNLPRPNPATAGHGEGS